MKKLLILFVLPLALLTSCGSTDDLANQIIDAIVSFGEASAKIDGVSTELNNYAGYRSYNFV